MSRNLTALLIDIGNIGFRHLQALGSIAAIRKIVLLEFSEDRRQQLPAMIAKDPNLTHKEIIFISDISAFAAMKQPDIIISAAIANKQELILQSIKKSWTIPSSFVLLEPPIASGPESLVRILNLFPSAYVNTARGLWPGYERLRKELDHHLQGGLRFEYSGNLWGLISNGVHYLHLFRLLSSSKKIESIKSILVDVENKRGKDFREFVGEMKFRVDAKHEFRLVSNSSDGGYGVFEQSGIFIRDWKGRSLYRINEGVGQIVSETAGAYDLQPLLVNESTKLALELLLENKDPGLPKVSDSAIDHWAIYDAMARCLGEQSDYHIA